MILIRFVLISLIAYLIIRSFVRYREVKKPVTSRHESEKGNNTDSKRVSKKIGEYIDYEDVGE